MSERLIRKLERLRERERDLTGIGSFEAALRCVIVFPSTYDVGMSNLGLHAIYCQLNGVPGVSCERAFIPAPSDIKEHHRVDAALRSIETLTPLAAFDVIAFSVSFEGDYTNLVRALDLAQVPAISAERNDFHPLIIAGGPAVTFNPAPLSTLVDAFAIGEGEPICLDLGEVLLDTWAQRPGSARRDFRDAAIGALALVRGVWVPGMPGAEPDGRVRRRVLRDLAQAAETVILTPDTQFANTFLIEAERGCGRGCRFCAAGHIYRPPRCRSMKDILGRVHGVGEHTRRVGLVGAAVSDHPAFTELIEGLAEEGFAVSASSVRVDRMDDRLARALATGGTRTATIAPEAGSHRLRSVTNKGFTDEDVLAAAERLAAAGIPRAKLYFMYGLPTETADDVEAIATLCGRIRSVAPGLELDLSVNPFVPKPMTPWQWEPMAGLRTLAARRERLLQALPAEVGASASFESDRGSAIQALLARGGPELGAVLLRVAREGDNWSVWQAALEEEGISLHGEVFTPRECAAPLPWDMIDVGVSRTALWVERERSLSGAVSEACNGDGCGRCNACGDGPEENSS